MQALVTQSCPTLWDLMDCSQPGSSLHGILQARIPEWVTHYLFQGIFLTWEVNPCLLCFLHCRQILYCLSHHMNMTSVQFSSVQFSYSVMSDSLWPHGLHHARLPCPSPTPRACSNSCQCCHPTISSSVVPFSSCPQSFPASGSFPVSQLFTSGGQSSGASASGPLLGCH